MKQGKTLLELGKELQRQRQNRQDFLANTRSFEVESTSYGSTLHLSLDSNTYDFQIGELAHQQIASRLNIPFRYYQKMQSDAPDLLDQNINRWLNQNPERRMIRVLDGKVRAFLSDRYRRLDNLELCAAVLPVIQEMQGSQIESCEVTPTHLYLKVVNRRIKAEVKVGDVVHIRITDGLSSCPNSQRCMFLPTLRAVANSLDRNISEPTVTELIAGVREIYLKKTSAYAVEPASVLYALHGQDIHSINERHTQGAILSEERLKDDITSGQFDLFGKILDDNDGVLGDLKVTSSFRLMKALGIYKQKVATGEFFKSGLKKGLPKFRSELRFDGVRDLLDWAIQLNYYRMLLEHAGFAVNRMFIQALCRDSGLRIAQERGISKSIYIIPINKISDHWLIRYFQHKAKLLHEAIRSNTQTYFAACLFFPRTLG